MKQFNCSQRFQDYLINRVYLVRDTLKSIIVSQTEAVETVTMGLFGVGQRDFNVENRERTLGCSHVLLCGSTGSGKTVLVKAISSILGGTNKRVSGIPDAQASDISGCEMFLLDSSKYVQHGPAYYANILLADEINRFSPRAQNAFIEMLAEQQVTIGDTTYKLKNPFFCVATINPSESSRGISHISEALSDRFVYKVNMVTTNDDEKVEVAKRTHTFDVSSLKQIITLDDVNEAREYFFDSIYIDDKVRYYCAKLLNTFNDQHNEIFRHENIALDNTPIFKQEYPANDRCMLHLESGAMATAMLDGREYVLPVDVNKIALRVLRGRLLLNPAAVSTLIDLYPELHTESKLVDFLINKALLGTKL